MSGAFDRTAFDNYEGTGGFFTGPPQGAGGEQGSFSGTGYRRRRRRLADEKRKKTALWDAIDAAFSESEARAEDAKQQAEQVAESLDKDAAAIEAVGEAAYQKAYAEALRSLSIEFTDQPSAHEAGAEPEFQVLEFRAALRDEIVQAEQWAYIARRRLYEITDDDDDAAVAMVVVLGLIWNHT